jgi:hypothetical protein
MHDSINPDGFHLKTKIPADTKCVMNKWEFEKRLYFL